MHDVFFEFFISGILKFVSCSFFFAYYVLLAAQGLGIAYNEPYIFEARQDTLAAYLKQLKEEVYTF